MTPGFEGEAFAHRQHVWSPDFPMQIRRRNAGRGAVPAFRLRPRGGLIRGLCVGDGDPLGVPAGWSWDCRSGVDERRQRAIVFGAVLGVGAATLGRRGRGAVTQTITSLFGAAVAAGVVGREHVALAVFGRTELGAPAARSLPCDRHGAILARESGDVERLRHRRIVDLALVEAFAGRVRGELEEGADDHPAALVVERDDLVLGCARVAGGHRPQADGARDGERFDRADQLAVGVLADFTDVHGRSPRWIDCDRTPCSITLFPPPFPPGRQADAAGFARRGRLVPCCAVFAECEAELGCQCMRSIPPLCLFGMAMRKPDFFQPSQRNCFGSSSPTIGMMRLTTATGLRRIGRSQSNQTRGLEMNMAVNEAANLGSAIKDAASNSKSVLVEATVQTRDDGSTPVVILSSDDAVRVISAHAPRIIYLVEQAFDLAGEIEAARDEMDDMGVERSPDLLKATQRRFAPHDGKIGATIASFMIDGVLHTAVSTATWHDEFGDAVEAILEESREGVSAGQVAKHSEKAKAIESKALVLVIGRHAVTMIIMVIKRSFTMVWFVRKMCVNF
jgi:hypothetical protein